MENVGERRRVRCELRSKKIHAKEMVAWNWFLWRVELKWDFAAERWGQGGAVRDVL